jgi:hypothetical protein
MDAILALKFNMDLLPNLLAILGLLMTWELHDLEVRAGRIQPRDIWDLSGLRGFVKGRGRVHMYVYATPKDSVACPACQSASGSIFAPTALRRKNFKPSDSSCTNPGGCRCELIGLVGNWPEGELLRKTLRESGEAISLSELEMEEFLNSGGAVRSGSVQDRLGLYMLEAMHAEGINPQFAISRYRSLTHVKDGEEHPFMVPAYLRLSELLERQGSYTAALSVVEEFSKTMRHKQGPLGPTRMQNKIMSVRMIRLIRTVKTFE